MQGVISNLSKILASLCRLTDWIELDLVGNPKDRFSNVEDQL